MLGGKHHGVLSTSHGVNSVEHLFGNTFSNFEFTDNVMKHSALHLHHLTVSFLFLSTWKAGT